MESDVDRDFPHKEITRKIIDAFYQVYRELGYGFSEAIYRRGTLIVLRDGGLDAVEEQVITVTFRGVRIGTFYADIVVAGVVLVEVKAAATIENYAQAQLLNYLKDERRGCNPSPADQLTCSNPTAKIHEIRFCEYHHEEAGHGSINYCRRICRLFGDPRRQHDHNAEKDAEPIFPIAMRTSQFPACHRSPPVNREFQRQTTNRTSADMLSR